MFVGRPSFHLNGIAIARISLSANDQMGSERNGKCFSIISVIFKLLSRWTEGIFYVQTPLDQTDTKIIKQMKTIKCSLECKIHARKVFSHCKDKFHIVII